MVSALAELLPRDDLRPMSAANSRRPRTSKSSLAFGQKDRLRRSPILEKGAPLEFVKVMLHKPVSLLSPAAAVGWPTRSMRELKGPACGGAGAWLVGPNLRQLAHSPQARARSSDRLRNVTAATAAAPAAVEESLRGALFGEHLFHLDLTRFSAELVEVRQRQLSTRRRLDRIRLSAAEGEGDVLEAKHAFRNEVEAVKAEVQCLLDDFLQDWKALQEVDQDLEDLKHEADGLIDTDVRMAELVSKITLGHRQ
eukprot:CAMPEP_0115165958 /NCGR_PEP_ID=MMETSP0227-20121206/73871_1 /TAXON_ID=89957 /ORGANISM="Polarella glacialis, Strain CCMP 1383" /LENGTH=252 /DNA_ID=CAMNT_0002578467 /DNA_START=99 /DNA_END=858 /DNA_ORIENTATION=+